MLSNKKIIIFATWFMTGLLSSTGSQASVTSADYAQIPLSLTQDKTPKVMLAMSNDHQLFYRAYSDYTDLDGDGVIDYRYKDGFDYSGYFDPGLCYQYDETRDLFSVLDNTGAGTDASNIQNGKRINEATGTLIRHSCINGWSGNFLNWISMSRIDVLRSVLYGGKRVVDHTAVPTGSSHGYAVLERTYLPNDVHSFGREYEDYDATENPDQVPLYHVADSGFVKDAITFCSTTRAGDTVPVLRVVDGSYPAWFAKESEVCTFDGRTGSPPSGAVYTDMTLRVEVCRNPQEFGGPGSRCKRYSDGTDDFYKPVGVLQRFGDDGRVDFGLTTGSYHKNTEGGVLRKQVRPFVNNLTAGDNEIDLNTGAVNTGLADGIINNIDRFEIVEYDPSGNVYRDCNTYLIPISEVKDKKSYGYHCSNWGNPISEIYYESLRYFAGNSTPLSDYYDALRIGSTDYLDTSFLTGGNIESSWTDPYADADDACAKCAVIVISSGPGSFDFDLPDDLNGDIAGLESGADLNQATNIVGLLEYKDIPGSTSLENIDSSQSIGVDKIASNNGFCTEKTLGSLADESGICADQPMTEGSYHIAGLSHFAKINDINPQTDRQLVNTYAIELSDSVPALNFNIGGNTITVTPACQSKRNDTANGWSDADAFTDDFYTYCSIADVRILDLETIAGKDSLGRDVQNLANASLVVVWENSQWGNDHDMDAFLRIDICTNEKTDCKDNAGNPLADGDFRIDHQVVGWSLDSRLRAAYSVTGTTNNGLVTGSGSVLWSVKNNQSHRLPADFAFHSVTDMPKQTAVHTVDSSGTAAMPISAPLFLAAKYGGFRDSNDNDRPDLVSEWDRVNNSTGAQEPDGLPDNYFKVRDPSTLGSQLGYVFTALLERVSSGSSAAVVANRASGNGAIYQAVYYPKWSRGDRDVTWVGQLHSLFIDDAGLIREDSDGDAVLDDYPVWTSTTSATDGDYIVDIYYSEADENTYLQRYATLAATGNGALAAAPVGDPVPVDDLKPIWNAADELAEYGESELRSQRSYSANASTGRYIFTTLDQACDSDGDGLTDDSCQTKVDFVVEGASGTTSNDSEYKLSGYLGFDRTVGTELAKAKSLINYTRGIEVAGARSRTTYNDSFGDYVWRLGDIVHSTPLVVEPPSDRYDTVFSDDTYEAFRETYKDRRLMVYVGANDGMIHAFNGGYWSTVCNGFYNRAIDTTSGSSACVNGVGSEYHELGDELWAYIPRNLLPHLRWLVEGDYPHVFYVDGEPESFDARIFEPSTVHPNGWGTILVVPMRTGGGEITVDHDSDGTADKTMRSAIVVLDITDPESEPEVLAEITDPELGLSVSNIELVQRYLPAQVNADGSGGGYATPTKNEWYLAFGNGPSAAQVGSTISNEDAQVFLYDLNDKVLYKNKITTETNSFAPSFSAVDWDTDGATDAVYIGTVKENIANQQGKVFRWNLVDSAGYINLANSDNIVPDLFIDTGQPIVAPPRLTRSADADRWLHFGTGRFYASSDQVTTMQQTVYGVREPRDANGFNYGTVAKSGLFDSSDIRVLLDGSIYNADGSTVTKSDGTTVIPDTIALNPYVETRNGWRRDLTFNNVDPSGRVLRQPVVYQDQLIFTEYLPSGNQCDVLGRSSLYNVGWANGVALPYNPLGITATEDFVSTVDGDEEYIEPGLDLGVGEFSGTTLYETNSTIVFVDSTTAQSFSNGSEDLSTLISDSQGGNCVFVQSSTGELVCQSSTSKDLSATGRQSWREVPILF